MGYHKANSIILYNQYMSVRSKLARRTICETIMPVPVMQASLLVKQIPKAYCEVPAVPPLPIPTGPFRPINPSQIQPDAVPYPQPGDFPPPQHHVAAVPFEDFSYVPEELRDRIIIRHPLFSAPTFTGTYFPPAPPPPPPIPPSRPTLDTVIQIPQYPPQEEPAAGTILTNLTGKTPTGYLSCDGSDIPRSTYPTLFAAIGIQFGEGDTFSTFTLPDLEDLNGRGNFYIIKI